MANHIKARFLYPIFGIRRMPASHNLAYKREARPIRRTAVHFLSQTRAEVKENQDGDSRCTKSLPFTED